MTNLSKVISWNRRPLRNLTFDDVYDIIFASQQDSQVELIVERVLELDENRGFERRHDPMRGYAEHRRSATPSGRYFSSEPMASPKAVSSRASSGYGGGGAYIASNSPYTDDYRYHYGGGYMGDYRYNYPPNHGMYMADYGMRRLKPRILGFYAFIMRLSFMNLSYSFTKVIFQFFVLDFLVWCWSLSVPFSVQ